MGKSIGIDLGTTNSVAAYSVDGTKPIVISTRERGRATPSVVARQAQGGSLLVGSTAVRFARKDPQNAIFSIKRLMGRRYHDEEVEKVKRHVNYRIVPPTNGNADMASVMIGDKHYTPIEVSALILESIKEDARVALGEEVTHAVITVPAYFDDNQREATRQAGGLAGLKVKRIIDEPTAAAYAFGLGLDPNEGGKTIIVYDLGGGTFDISVIFISEGIPTVENIEGNVWLGGDKFDQSVMDYVIDQVEREHPGSGKDLRSDAAFIWDLKQAAETAKKDLGQAQSSDIVIYGALRGKLDVNVTVHKADFESWIRPDIEDSVALVEKAMAKPGFTPEDIDHVLLVGGSTGLPLVRRLLAQKFGEEKIKATVDPMECVALGAAVLASRTEKKYCVRNHENEPDAKTCVVDGLDISDAEPRVKCGHCGELHGRQEAVCPNTGKVLIGSEGGITAKPYGIGIEGDRFKIIVPKGTRYPASDAIVEEFRTVAEAQERIIFPVYQGFEDVASKNEMQAEIVLPEEGEIPPDRRVPKGTPLDIGFKIDENGTLQIVVSGKGPLSWLKFAKVVRPWERRPISVGPQQSDETVGVSCPHCNHPNRRGARTCSNCGESLGPQKSGPDAPPQPDWKRDLSFEIAMAHTSLREYGWATKQENQDVLKAVLQRAERALNSNDEANGRLLTDELSTANQQCWGGINDLVQATFVYNASMGQLDQHQRLGSMLQEFKRRVNEGEDPRGTALEELRYVKIAGTVKEIMEGLGDRDKVPCQKCGKLRPKPSRANPRCPECTFNPFEVGQ